MSSSDFDYFASSDVKASGDITRNDLGNNYNSLNNDIPSLFSAGRGGRVKMMPSTYFEDPVLDVPGESRLLATFDNSDKTILLDGPNYDPDDIKLTDATFNEGADNNRSSAFFRNSPSMSVSLIGPSVAAGEVVDRLGFTVAATNPTSQTRLRATVQLTNGQSIASPLMDISGVSQNYAFGFVAPTGTGITGLSLLHLNTSSTIPQNGLANLIFSTTTLTAIPEPTSLAMVAAAGVAMVGRRRRR